MRRNVALSIAGIGLAVVAAGGLWWANRPGTLQLQLVPDDASVLLDGVEVGGGAHAVSPGVVELVVTAPGYVTDTRAVQVPAGGELPVSIALVREQGKVRVESDPPGARVRLEGPDTSPSLVTPFDAMLGTGSWKAVFDADDHHDATVFFEVGTADTVVRASLPPLVVAREHIGTDGVVSVMPGKGTRRPKLVVGAVRDKPRLDIRDPLTGALEETFPLPYRVNSRGIRWAKLDDDDVHDAVYGDARRFVVQRRGSKLRWPWREEQTGLVYYGRRSEGMRSPPAYDAATKLLVYGAADGVLRARSPKAIQPRWSKPMLPEDAFGKWRELDGPVAVHAGVVYAPSMDGGVYAVDLTSGDVLWRAAFTSEVRSAVSVIDELGAVAAIDTKGHFALLDAKTGEVRRSSDGEGAVLGSLPIWWEEGSWRRLKIGAEPKIEDLVSGDVLGDVPLDLSGVTRALLVPNVTDDFISVALLVEPERVRAIALDRTVDLLFDHDGAITDAVPVVYREDGSRHALVAWAEGQDLVIAELAGSSLAWWRAHPGRWPAVLPDEDGDGIAELLFGGDRLDRVSGSTGQILASTPVDREVIPLTVGERVVLVSGRGVATLDPATLEMTAFRDVAGSPAVHGRPVPLPGWALPTRDAGGVLRLDGRGEVADHVAWPADVYIPPVPVDDDIVLAAEDGSMARIGWDGTVRWQIDLQAPPMPGMGRVGDVIAVAVERTGVLGIDVATGEVRWRVKGDPVWRQSTDPATVDGKLAFSLGKKLVVVDAEGSAFERRVGDHQLADVDGLTSRIVDERGRRLTVQLRGDDNVGVRRLPGRARYERHGIVVLPLGGGLELRWIRGRVEVHRKPWSAPRGPVAAGAFLTDAGAVFLPDDDEY